MSVIRVEKNNNYTTMSNYHLKEKNMSLKAKGLLSQMLSLPDNWDYTIAGLVSINKENEGAIKSTLDELKKFGYLEVIKKLPNKTETGRIEYEYIVYENPKQEDKKQGVENQGVEFQGVENPGQLNINILNTNNKLTNNKNNKIKYPTLEEVKEYVKEKGYKVDPEIFFNYFEISNWIDSKGNKVKNWKQKLFTWNSYSKQQVQKIKKSYELYQQREYKDLSYLYANRKEK